MCSNEKVGDVSFVLSRVLTLGVPENFSLRKAPTRSILAKSVQTNAPVGFIYAASHELGMGGPAHPNPIEFAEEVLLGKGVGMFVKCEYLGTVPEGKRYGDKFTFSVTVTGRTP